MATTQQAAAPTDVEVQKVPLSGEQKEWLDKALALVDTDRMTKFDVGVTSIHSPTGDERAANEWLVEQMKGMGLDAFYQRIDDRTGNAVGYYPGSGGGPTMMLYAPIDTHIAVDPDQDVPWVAPQLRPDMLPQGYVDEHGSVIGLGSNNPKGMVTAIYGAMDAVTRAKVPLKGTVVMAFAGGGMPVAAPLAPQTRAATAYGGLGSGVSFMINHGVTADFGIIVKPGFSVAWEEVGLCWFKVTVRGYLGYAGRPHDIPNYKNSIADAAKVVLALHEWLPEYSKRNTSGLCTPAGDVTVIRGGMPHTPAFPPAATEIYLDVRCTPRQSPADVKSQFAQVIDDIRARYPEIDLDWEMFGAYPSASTDPDHWVVHSTMRGWEHEEGKPHQARTGTSGQTDASMIRNLGIPLARVGQPAPVPNVPQEWSLGLGGMGVAHIPDLARVARVLVYAVIDSCTRTRAEVGLSG